jgi:hypothetical protein
MSPQLLAAEMADFEERALADVDQQCRQALGNNERVWLPEDWDWRDARIDRVHAIFRSDSVSGEHRAAA